MRGLRDQSGPAIVPAGQTSAAEGSTRTLAVAAAATLLVLAEFSAVVPDVGESVRALHGGVSGQTWVLSGMSLGLAATLLTAGALADDLGRRRVLAWSSALLAVASAVGALAPSVGVLVAARLLQGAAGAGIVAASLGAIGHSFPSGAPRAFATSVWGAAVGGGIALGPLVGAALTSSLGWRSSYWLQALAATALLAAIAGIAESRSERPRRLDLTGAIVLTVAMASLTAGLVEGRSSWSGTATIALLTGGILLLGLFSAIELRRREPMLDLSLFREPLFIASISGALFTGLAVIGVMSFTPTLLERGIGISPLGGAAVLTAWSATSMVVAVAARGVIVRFTPHGVLAVGLLLSGGGELALSGLGVGSSWAQLVPGLVIAGIGSGLANPALGRLAVDSVPRHRAGLGSGSNNTARYLGGAAGVALVVALASSGGHAQASHQLISGYDLATTVCGVICVVGAAIAVSCNHEPIARIARPWILALQGRSRL
jgi:MFS family permease